MKGGSAMNIKDIVHKALIDAANRCGIPEEKAVEMLKTVAKRRAIKAILLLALGSAIMAILLLRT